MQKASFLAAFVLAIAGPASFAAGQEATLFLGASQDLADSVICLNGQSNCRGLRELKGEDQILKPLNATSGNKEIVCIGPCCERCRFYDRRLEEVVDRPISAAGDRLPVQANGTLSQVPQEPDEDTALEHN